jgi:hypothetical protein
MPFRLRLRHSDQISSRSGRSRQSGERVFASLRAGETRILSGKRWVWGRRVYLVATRLADGELLILATNHAPQTALADYRRRWGIEILQPQYPHSHLQADAEVVESKVCALPWVFSSQKFEFIPVKPSSQADKPCWAFPLASVA